MNDTKTVKLYDDTLTIHFSNKARNRYMIEETQNSPVGVTTILQLLSKDGLMLWPLWEGVEWLKTHKDDYEGALKAYTIKSDSGKSVGTEVHAAIESFLILEKVKKSNVRAIAGSTEIEKPLKAFLGWFDEVQPKVLATEQIIYSKELDYAGTFDALLEIDGEVVLCDVKTTNLSRSAPLGIYPEMFLQLGGYCLAHHEEFPEQQIDDLMIIRVGKEGKLYTLRASELGFTPKLLEDTFRQLVQLYRFMTPLKKVLTERKV